MKKNEDLGTFGPELYRTDLLVVPHKNVAHRQEQNGGRAIGFVTDDLVGTLKILYRHGGYAGSLECLGQITLDGPAAEVEKAGDVYRVGLINRLHPAARQEFLVLAKDSSRAVILADKIHVVEGLATDVSCDKIPDLLRVVDLRVSHLAVVYPEDAESKA